MHVPMPANGDLTPWTQRGVMLLNRCLTVGVGRPNSHQGKGWETITEAAIRALNARVDAGRQAEAAGGDPLGAQRAEPRAAAHQRDHHRLAASQPSVRIPRLLRLPPVLPRQPSAGLHGARNRSTGHCHRHRRIGPTPTPRLLRHGKVGSMALFTSKTFNAVPARERDPHDGRHAGRPPCARPCRHLPPR